MTNIVASHLRFTTNKIMLSDINSTIEAQSNTNMTCTDVGYYSKCCDYNGIYLDNGNCKCDDGYATYPNNNFPQCNYKQKSRLTVFLLQLFIGEISGAGFFYAGRISLALGQFLLFWVGLLYMLCMPFCVAVCTGANGENDMKCYTCLHTFICVLWVFAFVIFWFVGWILPISDNFKDGNGVELASW